MMTIIVALQLLDKRVMQIDGLLIFKREGGSFLLIFKGTNAFFANFPNKRLQRAHN